MAYWVRARVAVADYTTSPLGTQIWIMEIQASMGTGVSIPFACNIAAVQMHALTASATNDDSEFILFNVTTGVSVELTWTGADVMDRVSGLTFAVAADDQVALVQIQEDGTTEFADAAFILECDLSG